MRLAALLLTAGLLSPAASSAMPLTQEPSSAASTVDVSGAVDAIRQVLSQFYVLPERRPALDAVLAEGLASGRYDVSDPAVLAELINDDLRRVGQDQHLSFRFDPVAAVAINERQSTSDRGGYEANIRAVNHGVTALRILPGNVRLMTYDNFHWIEGQSEAALEHAVQFLAGGDAVIIDLRNNGGGSPGAVQYLISYFLPPETPLMTFYTRGGTESESESTLAELPSDRMIGIPLYLLTGPGTASAAEAFTGHVAGYGLGEVVGANTSGAGYTAMSVTMESQFILSVSVGRPVLASTGRDWESVGIAPTIAVDGSDPLDTAHAAALRALAGSATNSRRIELESLAEVIEARSRTLTPSLPLSSYAGVYGDRTILLEREQLTSIRNGRGPIPLIALGGNRFAFDSDPLVQLEFEVQGEEVMGVRYHRIGRPPEQTVGRSG